MGKSDLIPIRVATQTTPYKSGPNVITAAAELQADGFHPKFQIPFYLDVCSIPRIAVFEVKFAILELDPSVFSRNRKVLHSDFALLKSPDASDSVLLSFDADVVSLYFACLLNLAS